MKKREYFREKKYSLYFLKIKKVGVLEQHGVFQQEPQREITMKQEPQRLCISPEPSAAWPFAQEGSQPARGTPGTASGTPRNVSLQRRTSDNEETLWGILKICTMGAMYLRGFLGGGQVTW